MAARFEIRLGDEVLDDLRDRLRGTRWPDQVAPAWEQGTDLGYLRDLAAYWADGFDWRAREAELNRHEHYTADVGGVTLHFVRSRSGGVPLLLLHGWPSCFVEQLSLFPYLAPDFELVVPSLPGYGFSQRPPIANYRVVADLFHGLMRHLGHDRYAVHGGDFGAGVATYLALDHPDAVLGIHLSTPELSAVRGPSSPPLTEPERDYLARNGAWAEVERGYSSIQSTKPQTVGYGLNDSPVGLAAWILEKWRSWSDSGGDLDARFGRDFLLTLVTIYWATQTVTSSMRDYYDNRFHPAGLSAGDFVDVPTAFAAFGRHFVPEGEPPRELLERLYRVERWTEMPRGGHFAAAEEPELLAADIRAFVEGQAGRSPAR